MTDSRWYFLVRQAGGGYKWEAEPEGWEPNLDGSILFPWGMSSYLDEGMTALAEEVTESLASQKDEK